MSVRSPSRWYVYIVRCNDGTLYTGITNDLDRRVKEHNSANGGAKYTRSRRPVKLVYSEFAEDRSEAAKREYQIKRMTLADKTKLKESWTDTWCSYNAA